MPDIRVIAECMNYNPKLYGYHNGHNVPAKVTPVVIGNYCVCAESPNCLGCIHAEHLKTEYNKYAWAFKKQRKAR